MDSDTIYTVYLTLHQCGDIQPETAVTVLGRGTRKTANGYVDTWKVEDMQGNQAWISKTDDVIRFVTCDLY